MDTYVKIYFTGIIASVLMGIILSIVWEWWWIFLWPAGWVLLGLAACVDNYCGNIDEKKQNNNNI